MLDSNNKLVFSYIVDPKDWGKEITIKMPENTVANTVKVIMNGEDKVLSLKSVKIFEKVIFNGKRRFMDIPIGNILDVGMKVNYLTLVQGLESGEKGAMSFISGMKIINGK